MGMMDRDFGRGDMGMNRPFGDTFGGLSKCTYTHIRILPHAQSSIHTVSVCCDVYFLYQVEEWEDMEEEWGTLAWAQWVQD